MATSPVCAFGVGRALLLQGPPFVLAELHFGMRQACCSWPTRMRTRRHEVRGT